METRGCWGRDSKIGWGQEAEFDDVGFLLVSRAILTWMWATWLHR